VRDCLNTNKHNVMVEWLVFLFRTLEVPFSNIGLRIVYRCFPREMLD
jgi:hypothetical protein